MQQDMVENGTSAEASVVSWKIIAESVASTIPSDARQYGTAAYQIGGHDDDCIGKTDCPPFGVCQSAIVQHTQQNVHDLWVGFLHLVQQDYAVRPPANRL